MKKQQAGFTMIELVMVIVILGILAAFALPRFADLGGDARTAARSGIEGSVRSAASITRTACLARTACDQSAATSTVVMDGATINTVFGYPAASATGIVAAAQVSGVTVAHDTTATPNVTTFTVATDCTVTYTAAANATTAPVIDGVTTGC